MRRFLSLSALALFMPAMATASEIAEKQARSIPLKDGSAVVYFTLDKSVFEVVTTVAASEKSPAFRFTHRLGNGESATIELSGKVDAPASRIVLTRSGDKLRIENSPVEKAEVSGPRTDITNL